LPRFFYTSTEFRTDDLWAVFWLLSLVVAVTGTFTLRRAFVFGFILGLAFSVSLKTLLLTASVGIATAVALALGAWFGSTPIPWKRLPLYLLVIFCATVLIPAALSHGFRPLFGEARRILKPELSDTEGLFFHCPAPRAGGGLLSGWPSGALRASLLPSIV